LVGVDSFLPEIADIGVIRLTYGNHNIFGEFLLGRGINLHYLTLIPLIVLIIIIWNKEIRDIFKNLKKGIQ
jgi:hypothetical protein